MNKTSTSLFSSSHYAYDLPKERIAQHPIHPRDSAALLVVDNKKNTKDSQHHHFYDLPDLLAKPTTLFLNHSRVLPVRLWMHKEPSKGRVELFLLGKKDTHLSELMTQPPPLTLEALIRPKARVPVGTKLHLKENKALEAHVLGQGQIKLDWTPKHHTLKEILKHHAVLPLPPYMTRPTTPNDTTSYQCIYATEDGSVAAPTAGLHFTEQLLARLHKAGHHTEALCLHIGAATFQPLRKKDLRSHDMHTESLHLTRPCIQRLLECKEAIAVGTTTLRSLESLYWYGCLLAQSPRQHFNIPSFVYHDTPALSLEASLENVLLYLKKHDLGILSGTTALYITPGYKVRSVRGLISNFHQPHSTLLVLVASLVGSRWKEVYHEALAKGYRFLSYGDACLFRW